MEPIDFKDFCFSIKKAVKIDISKNFYFSCTLDYYFADYRPLYPEHTTGDFLISYDWFAAKTTLSQNTACVPIIKTYSNFNELLQDLKSIE